MNKMITNINKEKFSKNAIWLVLILLVVIFTIINPSFISIENIMILLRQIAIIGIVSVGMTFVILLGDIDLSVGSIITFVNIFCSYLMVKCGINMWIAIFLSLISSIIIGLLNGFMVSRCGIPALIATFATQIVFSGLSLKICDGVPISGFDEKFRIFGQGYIFDVIPIPVVIMAICFIFGIFILNKTYFGRYFYAVGGNVKASKLAGIDIEKIKYLAFAMAGLFAGFAGIVMLSRTNSGMGNAGLGYEFKVITCVVLGGVSVNGGSGRLSGVIAGTLIIGILQNGMVLINIDSYTQNIIMGVVLALAVGFDCWQRKSPML